MEWSEVISMQIKSCQRINLTKTFRQLSNLIIIEMEHLKAIQIAYPAWYLCESVLTNC